MSVSLREVRIGAERFWLDADAAARVAALIVADRDAALALARRSRRGTVPPGGAGVVVPPRSQGVVPLAGLAIGEERPVVRVQATGAPVQASLQSSITRTLTAGGVDQVGALAQPATDAAILMARTLRDAAPRSPLRAALRAYVDDRLLPEPEPVPRRRALLPVGRRRAAVA